jgi:anti-sigma factor RsiW
MNPDKLFDYLDGKLSPADREELEKQLANDSQLLRQLAVARDIHRNMRDSREVLIPSENPDTVARGARLGRQIAVAAMVLVFLNVVGGLAVITWKSKKPVGQKRDEMAGRQQVEESLDAAGRNALPTPSLADDEINLAMPRAAWDRLASSVISAAEAVGGFGIRDDREHEVIITASVPRSRAGEFRRQLLGPNALAPSQLNMTGETATIQVRNAEAAR